MADKVKVELELPEGLVEVEGKELTVKEKPANAKVSTKEKSEAASESKSKSEDDKSKSESKDDSADLSELLKSPVTPPKNLGGEKGPKPGQKRSLIIGLVLIFVAIIVWPVFGFTVALAEAVVGVTLIAVGTFVKV